MAYRLPAFNLAVNIWRGPPPVAGAPATLTIGCLRVANMQQFITIGPFTVNPFISSVSILLPTGTDVRDGRNGGASDVIECPAGSGAKYSVVAVWDSGKGFANEHRVASIMPLPGWPVPYP